MSDPQQSIPRLTLTYLEAAQATGYSERHIVREVAAGRLPVIKSGRLRRIAVKDLEAWIDRNRTETAPAVA